MSFSLFEKNLVKRIEPELPTSTPGVQIQAHWQGKKICDISLGETFPYYDFASMTKIIFTVQALMHAFEQKKWNIKSTVQEFLPWFQDEKTLITDLLTHSSGLVWWMPFYQKLDLSTSKLNRWTEAARLIRGLELETSKKSVYSDVGFITLGHVLEVIYEKPLKEVWRELKERDYPKSSMEFHDDNKPVNSARFYAPTERCQWRGKLIQGEVHDDNTWAFGGVSSHAGLFGSIDDLGWYGLFLRSQMKGISKTLVKQKTAKLFTTRALAKGKGDWSLGFMMPTPGQSSSGTYFSPLSVGHSGFTGTSIWYDPTQDLSVGILSNRVFLGRENKEFAKLRPQIHNWIVEGLRRA